MQASKEALVLAIANKYFEALGKGVYYLHKYLLATVT